MIEMWQLVISDPQKRPFLWIKFRTNDRANASPTSNEDHATLFIHAVSYQSFLAIAQRHLQHHDTPILPMKGYAKHETKGTDQHKTAFRNLGFHALGYHDEPHNPSTATEYLQIGIQKFYDHNKNVTGIAAIGHTLGPYVSSGSSNRAQLALWDNPQVNTAGVGKYEIVHRSGHQHIKGFIIQLTNKQPPKDWSQQKPLLIGHH